MSKFNGAIALRRSTVMTYVDLMIMCITSDSYIESLGQASDKAVQLYYVHTSWWDRFVANFPTDKWDKFDLLRKKFNIPRHISATNMYASMGIMSSANIEQYQFLKELNRRSYLIDELVRMLDIAPKDDEDSSLYLSMEHIELIASMGVTQC